MKKEWLTLKKCLMFEESMLYKAKKQCIKDDDLNGALENHHCLENIQWVLREMENIEETGETL